MVEHLRPVVVSDSPPVRMCTAPNAGPKTLTGTHTYVVGKKHVYVIDPGPAIDAYQDAVASWLVHWGHVEAILLSHGHPDHSPGAARLAKTLRAPVWASSSLNPAEAGTSVDYRFGEVEAFVVDGDILRALPAPGHSHDHVAFWLETARILFAGDTILGTGSTLVAPPEGDMLLYMQTLQRMGDLHPRRIAPGHGPLIDDPDGKIAEYMAHRTDRERRLLNTLSDVPVLPETLVSRLYADVDPALHGLALGSVLAQLSKLEREGRVSRSSGGYVVADSPMSETGQ